MVASSIKIIVCFVIFFGSLIHSHVEEPKNAEEWFDSVLHAKQKATKLHFYFHQRTYGYDPNPTAAPVAQANTTLNSPTLFGLVVMTDDPLTIGPERSSKPFGHTQGMYGSTSMEELTFHVVANFVFTDGVHNGSTISVFGSDPPLQPYRELSIIGGSGVFRMARGIVKLHNVYFDFANRNATVEVNVMALHY